MEQQILSRPQKAQRDRLKTQRDRNGARNAGKGLSFIRAKTSSHGQLKKQ